jgi:hypothetical protein
MGLFIAIAQVWAILSGRLHGSAISDAIASLLLHKYETNKMDSKRTKKDEEIGPIPIFLAQFV